MIMPPPNPLVFMPADAWIAGIGPAGYPDLPEECLPSPTPGR